MEKYCVHFYFSGALVSYGSHSFDNKNKKLTCRPLKEHSHHPSLVFCSSTVSRSPRRNASSSGDSAMLSYRARAIHCNKMKK